jgi:hypothetical protein
MRGIQQRLCHASSHVARRVDRARRLRAAPSTVLHGGDALDLDDLLRRHPMADDANIRADEVGRMDGATCTSYRCVAAKRLIDTIATTWW